MDQKGKQSKGLGIGCIGILVLVLTFILAGWAMPTPGHASSGKAPDKIRIGQAIALSGPTSFAAKITQINATDLWIKHVNEKGGILLKKYNKRVPVEIIRYDDKSEIGTCVKMVEKLILDDKVDMLLPPWGTAWNFAIAPIVTRYKYPVLGTTIDSMKLREMAHSIPYMFIHLNQPPEKAEAMLALCKELGVKTAAVIHHTDLHGIEVAGYIMPRLSVGGIDVTFYKTYPIGAKDHSQLLKRVKAANVDALLAFSYPPGTMLITKQAKAVELNPKLFYCSIGTAFSPYRAAFGANVVEGVMGMGAWNPKVPYAGAKEFWADLNEAVGPDKTDYYAPPNTYSSLQVIQQAIEKAGSIDRQAIRDIIATETFDTIIGPVKYENQFNIQSPGEVGQWQKGSFEIVAGKKKRTAEPIYPKPPWPK